jgi:hypothetical protein
LTASCELRPRGDWRALADCFAPSLYFDDRRPLLRMELPKEGFLEQHRVLFDVPNGRWITTAIATRGERPGARSPALPG